MTDYKGWPKEDVERRARTLCHVPGNDFECEGPDCMCWRNFVKGAIATLEADHAAGLVLVPREATEEMVEAFRKSFYDNFNGETEAINAALEAGAVLPGRKGGALGGGDAE